MPKPEHTRAASSRRRTTPLSPQYLPGIPDDDEELSETAICAIEEGRADHAAGRTFTMADVKRDLGIEP